MPHPPPWANTLALRNWHQIVLAWKIIIPYGASSGRKQKCPYRLTLFKTTRYTNLATRASEKSIWKVGKSMYLPSIRPQSQLNQMASLSGILVLALFHSWRENPYWDLQFSYNQCFKHYSSAPQEPLLYHILCCINQLSKADSLLL
jgi:hypothetical protein